MKELFFSLISRKLFIVLLEDNMVLAKICEDNYRKHSENFVSKISEAFGNVSFSVGDLDKIFFLTGPGGQTGERVSFSFVLGSLLSSSTIRVFSMDSLTFQAATSGECLSVISVGTRNKRYYLTVHQDGSISFRREGINEREFEKVRTMFSKLAMEIDFGGVDFLYNFLACKNDFKAFRGELA